jgi:PDZ domain-containing secreted protein
MPLKAHLVALLSLTKANPPTFTKVAITAVNGTTFARFDRNIQLVINVGDTVRLDQRRRRSSKSVDLTLYQITAVSGS